MSVLSGRWTGQIAGTNVGSFVLDLEADGDDLRGTVALDDFNQGRSTYDAVGRAEQSHVTLDLTPRAHPPEAEVGTVRVEGSIQEDGSLSGEWRSEVGTHGTLLAFKQDAAATTAASQPPIAISYQKRRGVIPCAVDSEALRRIFRDLSAGSDEAARLQTARQAQLGALTGTGEPQTLAHHAQVRSAYSPMVLARGTSGEQKISLDPALLEEENLPKPLQVVEFDIGAYYQITNQQQQAPNRARVVLDFTKPPPFDPSNPSLAPTPNNSSIEVIGSDSMWVSGVYEKLVSTLQQGRLRNGWLHSRYTYDLLLVLIGLPGTVAVATLFGQWLGRSYFDSAPLPQLGGFILAFWVALLTFRFAFSAVRWLLPLVEYAPPVQPLHRQIRVAISVVLLGLFSSITATALWYAFSSAR